MTETFMNYFGGLLSGYRLIQSALYSRLRLVSNFNKIKRTKGLVSTTWLSVVREVFRLPFRFEAGKYINEIQQDGVFWKVKLHGFQKWLYWPSSLNLNDLRMVIVELCDKTHWHNYQIAETMVQEGDIVLDCGASEGLFGLQNCCKAKKVLLVEPLQCFVQAMRKTFSETPNCEIIPMVLGASEGSVNLSVRALSSSVSVSGVEVRQSTIDTLVSERGIWIDYVKADVEGAEFALLEGASKTICEMKPRMAITTYHSQNSFIEIRDFVLSLVPEYNYLIKGISSDYPKPIMIHFWCAHHIRPFNCE